MNTRGKSRFWSGEDLPSILRINGVFLVLSAVAGLFGCALEQNGSALLPGIAAYAVWSLLLMLQLGRSKRWKLLLWEIIVVITGCIAACVIGYRFDLF